MVSPVDSAMDAPPSSSPLGDTTAERDAERDADPRTVELRKPIAIVTAGHWLLAHDCIGPRIAELIKDRYGSDVALFEAGSTALGLLDCLAGQQLLVVVDACSLSSRPGGSQPGQLHEVQPDFESPSLDHCSVHQFGPLETLAIAKHLYPEDLPANTRLLLVETQGIDQTGIETACGQVVAALDRTIADYRSHGYRDEPPDKLGARPINTEVPS